MRTFHRHKWVLQTSSVLWNCLHTFYFCAIVILKFNNENRKMKYDIFISYRREGGRDVARPIKLELEKHGYMFFSILMSLKMVVLIKKLKMR